VAKKPNLQPQNDGYATVHTVRIPLWPYLVPLLFCLAAWPVTYGAHRAFGTSAVSAGWTGVSVALTAVGILIFTFFLSRPRGVVMQVMSLVNAGLAIAWCVPAIIEGPASKAKFGFWLLFTLFICFDCAVYRIMRQSRGPEDPRHGVINGELAEFGEAVKQLKGAKFTPPVIEGAKVSTQVAMPPGRSFEEVSGARKEVASLLDVPATAIRTVPDRDSERRGTVVAVPVDQLREPRPAPPLEYGLSMADPILLGVDENGDYAEIILPGDPQVNRNAVGVFGVVGMSGSGKSELLLHFSKQVATRVDGELNVIDCRKEGQLPGWLRRAAKQMMSGKDEALDWMDSLEQRIAERSRWLGQRGYKQWVRGCGVPFETYLIFEAAAIVRDSNIVDLAESVRSVGICVGLELQRATYDRLPTSARATKSASCS